ncbi:hypothetical protein UY3_14160 [Chelonia mydas]|uniref:Uncharacterized protein n=1 Tax=Chelonia mydas TaxID=8469 RepID=M7B9D0_CHEMY|nr:hypothetical protein UY3_14160 [Chelonia mydas]
MAPSRSIQWALLEPGSLEVQIMRFLYENHLHRNFPASTMYTVAQPPVRFCYPSNDSTPTTYMFLHCNSDLNANTNWMHSGQKFKLQQLTCSISEMDTNCSILRQSDPDLWFGPNSS